MKTPNKANGVLLRLRDIFYLLPKRIGRLGLHIVDGTMGNKHPTAPVLPLHPVGQWWLELVFLVFDVLALPEIYETLLDVGKRATRPLTAAEIALAKSVFGDSIQYDRVRVDETATVVCRRHHIYYVSFYTINSWGTMDAAVFIHEMMHVWQFERVGSAYIPRALLAQRTALGYNYGGTDALLKAFSADAGFTPFNYEQQAEIVADYFCLRNGLAPSWCPPGQGLMLPLFEYFAKKLAVPLKTIARSKLS